MEENNFFVSPEQPAPEPVVQNTGSKLKGLKATRSLVMVFLQISNIAFCVMMAYLLVTFLMSCFGSDLSGFFGYEGFDFGFMEAIGVLIYFCIAIVIAIAVAVAIGFVQSNQKFYNVLKTAKKENLGVVLTTAQTVGSTIWMVVAIILMGFVALYFIQNAIISITAILLYICIIALILALIATIVHSSINRNMYNKLTAEEKAAVKERSSAFNVKVKKRERKANAGKLY